MKIEILGRGCYNCFKLETLINERLQELGKSYGGLVSIDDERRIRKVMPPYDTPGLVIEGRLVSTREEPDRETLKGWLASIHEPTRAVSK